MSKIIEAMAKAICEASGLDWTEADYTETFNRQEKYKRLATAAYAAALAHLEKPTPEMIEAGRIEIKAYGIPDVGATTFYAERAFTAMIRAAK